MFFVCYRRWHRRYEQAAGYTRQHSLGIAMFPVRTEPAISGRFTIRKDRKRIVNCE